MPPPPPPPPLVSPDDGPTVDPGPGLLPAPVSSACPTVEILPTPEEESGLTDTQREFLDAARRIAESAIQRAHPAFDRDKVKPMPAP
jgi:hypothetical protein